VSADWDSYIDTSNGTQRLDAPGNTEQHVVVLEDKNPDAKKSLNIKCDGFEK
jgi:hypothetical protein